MCLFLNLRRKLIKLRRKLVKLRRKLVKLHRSFMNTFERKHVFIRTRTTFPSEENNFQFGNMKYCKP